NAAASITFNVHTDPLFGVGIAVTCMLAHAISRYGHCLPEKDLADINSNVGIPIHSLCNPCCPGRKLAIPFSIIAMEVDMSQMHGQPFASGDCFQGGFYTAWHSQITAMDMKGMGNA